MKTIMENWNRFSDQKNKDLLEEGLKEILFALTVFSGGSAILYNMMKNQETTVQQIQDELSDRKTKITDYSSYGLGPKNVDVKQQVLFAIDNKFSDDLIPAPAKPGFSYIFYPELPSNYSLPMTSITVSDYENYCEQFDILDLASMLYGPAARWGYNVEPGVTDAPLHYKDGNQVLPPSWSVMFGVFYGKTTLAIENFNKAVDQPEELEKVAEAFGFDNAQHLEKEIKRLKIIIDYDEG